MKEFAQLVRDGLNYQALKLDSNVDPVKVARDEQMERIVNANGLRVDSLPANGIHYINVLGLKVDDANVDPQETARAEQMARICSANNR